MGIRFRCPNGHKLHVKAFLAGKRGICPHCGEKFEIPLESDPELAKAAKHAAPPANSASQDPELSVAEPKSAPTDEPKKPVPAAVDVADLTTDQPVVDVNASVHPIANADQKTDHPVDVVPVAQAKSSTAKAAEGADPIDEAPHAVWYVRPPSGGQFGPASADVMRSWITEGRVTADSLVWREGWPEWKQAGPLFPGVSDADPNPSVSAVPQIVTQMADGSSAELYRRRKSNTSTLTVVFLLLVACVILFGALVYVVKFMN